VYRLKLEVIMPELAKPERGSAELAERVKSATDSQREVFEAGRSTMREYGKLFRELRTDPVVKELMNHCAATGRVIVCTPSWRIHQPAEFQGRNYTNVWDRAIALTQNGFRRVDRYVHRDFAGAVADKVPGGRMFTEMAFPRNRLISLSYRQLLDMRVPPGQIKAMLYEAADKIADSPQDRHQEK